jgi:hypothetical protein
MRSVSSRQFDRRAHQLRDTRLAAIDVFEQRPDPIPGPGFEHGLVDNPPQTDVRRSLVVIQGTSPQFREMFVAGERVP